MLNKKPWCNNIKFFINYRIIKGRFNNIYGKIFSAVIRGKGGDLDSLNFFNALILCSFQKKARCASNIQKWQFFFHFYVNQNFIKSLYWQAIDIIKILGVGSAVLAFIFRNKIIPVVRQGSAINVKNKTAFSAFVEVAGYFFFWRLAAKRAVLWLSAHLVLVFLLAGSTTTGTPLILALSNEWRTSSAYCSGISKKA